MHGDYITASLFSVLLTGCYLGDQIKKNEMGGHERQGEVPTAFWWSYLMERDCLEHTGVDGTIMLK
jgi:hypothetical protein